MLIDCPDCGTSVSDKADSCKSCGYSFAVERFKAQRKSSLVGCGVIFLVFVVGTAMFLGMAGSYSEDWYKDECKKLNKELSGGKFGRSLCDIPLCAKEIATPVNSNKAREVISSTGNPSGAWVVLVANAEQAYPKECKAK